MEEGGRNAVHGVRSEAQPEAGREPEGQHGASIREHSSRSRVPVKEKAGSALYRRFPRTTPRQKSPAVPRRFAARAPECYLRANPASAVLTTWKARRFNSSG